MIGSVKSTEDSNAEGKDESLSSLNENLDLWMALFSQLKTLACDARPECRRQVHVTAACSQHPS